MMLPDRAKDACLVWGMLFSESIGNLRAMGQRSALALLGIVVGCASVVALLVIGRSASADAMSTFEGMGTDMLVASFPEAGGAHDSLPDTVNTQSLHTRLPDVAHIAPVVQYSSRISHQGASFDGAVVGSTPALAAVVGLSLASGRELSRFDGDGLFAVLGAQVAQSLEVNGRAVQPGDWLRIAGYQFQVIGVLNAEKHNPLLPLSVDTSVFIPERSIGRLSPDARISNVIARVHPGANLEQAATELESELAQSLNGRKVQVQIPRQLLDGIKRQSETFAWLLAGLGGISLLVAGVGVMNVMLMSVRERRREIGVRMAIGARPRDIRILFLLEAAHLCVAGALLGALLGCLIAGSFAVLSGWAPVFSADALVLGIASSILTGLFFGYYPAASAAGLSPAVALRDD